MRLTNIYGASSSRTKYGSNNDYIYEIGKDDDETIYFFNNNHYKLTKNNTFEPYNPKNLVSTIKKKIPTLVTENSITSKFPLTYNNYKFKGIIANKYYKQYFLLYEKEFADSFLNEHLYKYILVKKQNDNLNIIHKIPPRSQINLDENVVFSYGSFQMGPFIFI
jgi:hypothetical protein